MQTYETHKWSPHNRCHTGLFLLRPVHDARADAACYADKGGSVPRLGDAVYQHHCSYLFAATRLVRNSPASPCCTSGEGQDGSAPPLFAAVSARGEGGVTGGVTSPTPLFRGRSRPIDPCGKARDTDDKRALTRRRQAP